MDWNTFKTIGIETIKDWRSDRTSQLAAAISYYAVFASAPLLMLVVIVAGMVLGEEAAQGKIVEETSQYVSGNVAEVLQDVINSARDLPGSSLAALGSLLFAAYISTMMMRQVQAALNIIWGLVAGADKSSATYQTMAIKYLKSLIAAVGMVLLVVVLLVGGTFLSSLDKIFEQVGLGILVGSNILGLLLAIAVMTLAFALIFRYMAEVRLEWHDTWWGAGVTAVLFVIGNLLIGVYLGRASYASLYGAAGAFLALLAWVYYSAQIFLFGAEFTQHYANKYGSAKIRQATDHQSRSSQSQEANAG